MDYQLPTSFDLIIIGTGMLESILSAAASRIGKKVLQIDRNSFYGGQWGSFSLETIQKLEDINVSYPPQSLDEVKGLLKNGEEFEPLGNTYFNIQNIQSKWHISGKEQAEGKSESENDKDADTEKEEKQWSPGALLKESRKFNLDLIPKLQYARGEFVELLISSNIARYSEYRSVSRVLTWLDGELKVVPCSRSDVFANTNVSVVEKRMLMKLHTSLDEVEKELEEYESKTFREYLKDKELTPNLIHYVLYALSMSDDETPCRKGIDNTKRFLTSLGRFGKTPFLFSMYGSGEITQAFCRLSAVFGGVFALGQTLHGLVVSDNKFKGLIANNQRIEAENLIVGTEHAPKKYLKISKYQYIARAILITNKSIMPSEKEHLTLLMYPPENGKNSAVIIESGGLTGTCPKDLYVVHLTTLQNTSPEDDFKHIISNLFIIDNQDDANNDKPKVLWSTYFALPDSNKTVFEQHFPENVSFCTGPDMDLDYDPAVQKAKAIFSQLYPTEEFLPRAPDPEEIVIEGEDECEEAQ